jgi:CheY-like chemotaxis protein
MNLQPTVLIVDDEKHTRDGLRSLLENDYDVYVAPDIAGAINVLSASRSMCFSPTCVSAAKME